MFLRALGFFGLFSSFFPVLAAAAPVRVAGWVFLPDGLAADKAEVALFPAGLTREAMTARLTGQPAASAAVGSDGRFELAAEPGRYRLRVSRDGFLPVEPEIPPLVEETDLAPVVLRTARPFALRLAGSDGKPAAGATVFASGERPRAPWNARALSGADGRLTLPVAPGELATLRVIGPGHADVLTARPPAQGELTLRLARRAPVAFEVRGADGKPVPDALVTLGETVVLGRTDAAGRLTATFPAGEDPVLLAWGPGGERSRPTPDRLRGKAPLLLRIAPPVVLSGRIVDPAGKPVAGALVFTSTGPSALSGPEGIFKLPVPAGETGLVQAFAPGLLWAETPFAPGHAVHLSLRQAASLAGRALDGEGRPVPGARITALCTPPGAGDGDTHPWPFATSTRADGSFRLGEIVPGAHCTVAAGRRALASAPERATAPAAGLRLTLAAGLTVAGRVTGPRGEPLELAEVTLAPEEAAGASRPVSTLSGVDGRFEMAPVAPGAFHLTLRHPGFLALERPAVKIGAPAAGGAAVDLGTFRLEPGLALQGVVVDAKGAPVEGARVTAVHLGRNSRGDRDPARQVAASGADGRFEVTGLFPGEAFRLEAERQGYAPVGHTVTTPSPGPLRFELGALRFLSGRVLGPLGEPIPGANLSAVAERQVRHGLGSSGSGWSRGLGQSDAEGRFRVQVPEPGALDLEVTAQGWRSRLVESLEVPEEGELEGIEVRLDRGASLTGRVFDGQAPAVGAQVDAFPRRDSESLKGDWGPAWGETDAAGRYRLEGLETGPYWVNVQMQDRGQMQKEITVSAEGAVLDFHLPTAEVSGRLLGEDGQPIPRGEITLSQPLGGLSFSVQARPGGGFRFGRVADGPYHLNAWAPGFAPLEKPLAAEVSGASVTGLEIRLRRATARLTGRILGISTEEAAAARVEARLADPNGHESEAVGRVGGEGPGHYRLEGLSAGDWRVTAKLPPDRVAWGQVVLEPGMSEAVLDLTVPSTFELRGRVTVNGTPRPGAQVEIQGPTSRETTSGADGRFLLERLAEGEYLLLATIGKDHSILRPVELSGNQELALDLETGALRGQLTDPATGEPLAGCRIALRHGDETSSVTGPTVLSGEMGDFAVPDLATGRYQATIECPGRPPLEKPVVMAAPETVLDVAVGG